jgi:uncharacterized OsmC-like protein
MINGVDTGLITETVEAVQSRPELGAFKFRAKNRLVAGGLNRSEIGGFFGAGQDHRTAGPKFVVENDEPPVLWSQDKAPNPVEYALQALLACMTTTTAYKAAGQGIEIESITSEAEGDLDVQGILGLDPDVRPGYQEIRATLRIKTRGDREAVRNLHRSSPVFDTLARPVPIKVQVVFED